MTDKKLTASEDFQQSIDQLVNMVEDRVAKEVSNYIIDFVIHRIDELQDTDQKTEYDYCEITGRVNELKELLKRFHKDGSKVGSGSTAAALREELRTGLPVGDKFHTMKTEEAIRALNNWLESNPLARHGDRAAAENMLRDLLDAAKGLNK